MLPKAKITEVRFHGRGGQGVVTASRLLGEAALREGKYIQAWPEFGPERSGAPVTGFTRISDEKFTIKSSIYTPNIVCVIDPTLIKLVKVTDGLVKGGSLILNSTSDPADIKRELAVQGTVSTVDATTIALDTLGVPIANTSILGALVKTTDVVSLESLFGSLRDIFKGAVGEKNVEAVKRSYEEVKIA